MYRMYSDIATKTTYIEAWGASTKHPDIVHTVKHDNPLGWLPMTDLIQCFLRAASETMFPFHMRNYMEKAMELYDFQQQQWKLNGVDLDECNISK